MTLKAIIPNETLATVFALVWLVPCVSTKMYLKVTITTETLATIGTFLCFDGSSCSVLCVCENVSLNVFLQQLCTVEGLFAPPTLKGDENLFAVFAVFNVYF